MASQTIQAAALFLALCFGITLFHGIIGCMESERQSLLDFKRGLNDPSNRLSSWVQADEECCLWEGVGCDNRTGHIIHLSLQYPRVDNGHTQCISGEISPSLLRLSHLKLLDLSGNCFRGAHIPPFLGSLRELRYLNLSKSQFGGIIPHQLGNLSKLISLDLKSPSYTYYTNLQLDNCDWLSRLTSLQYLRLTSVNFTEVSNWLHVINMLPSLLHLDLQGCGINSIYSLPLVNFTFLSYLDLSSYDYSSLDLNTRPPEWIFNLTSLRYLNLSRFAFYGSLPSAIGNLRSLEVLGLSDLSLGGIPEEMTSLCKLKKLGLRGMNDSNKLDKYRGIFSGCMRNSLEALDLSFGRFSGQIPSWFGEFKNLRSLSLNFNKLLGPLPASFRRLSLLEELFLSYCRVKFPSWLGELKNLKAMDFCCNSLSGPIPDFLGDLRNLRKLDLSSNSFYGSVPDSLGRLASLQKLELRRNQLNGTVTQNLGQLSNLVHLDLSYNSLEGVLIESHFANLTRLKYLDLSSNSLILKLSSDWIPPFQLEVIDMSSCRLGPRFPLWLQSQANLYSLALSNTSISDTIPDWFWGISPGQPNFYSAINETNSEVLIVHPCLDLSNNFLSGHLPQSIGKSVPYLESLFLSQNNISGSIPSSLCDSKKLFDIDLSWNHFSGEFPSCKFSTLGTVRLSNNKLSGGISGYFPSLISLQLNHNCLSGEFPSALKNCLQLDSLDLGHNKLSGRIPTWIGESLPWLRVLTLRYNMLTGRIPSQLALLEYLQILDLSQNNLVGPIPKSFANLSAMQVFEMPMDPGVFYQIPLDRDILLMIKGKELGYDNVLFVNVLDLSDNSLSGSIPEELANLVGLLSLNLSGNYLNGSITEKIGDLQQLESLDLSRNELSGTIPSNLSALHFLSSLNLSYNNLTGRIPTGSQLQTLDDPSIYIGNNDLCGFPLAKKCPGDEKPTRGGKGIGEGWNHGLADIFWLYFGAAVGFVAGFWVLCGVLVLKGAWRIALFRFTDEMCDRVYVTVAVCVAKLKRT